MFEYKYLIFVVFSRLNNSLVVSLIDKHLLNKFLLYIYIKKFFPAYSPIFFRVFKNSLGPDVPHA